MYDLFRDVLSSLGFFQTLKMAPGFRFFTVFFFTGSRGQGSGFSLASRRARVQIFHWFFSGFSLVVQLFHRRGGSRVQAFHCFFFFTGSRGQGSGLSLASGAQGSFFHGLEGPGFRFFTGVGALGFRIFTGGGVPKTTNVLNI